MYGTGLITRQEIRFQDLPEWRKVIHLHDIRPYLLSFSHAPTTQFRKWQTLIQDYNRGHISRFNDGMTNLRQSVECLIRRQLMINGWHHLIFYSCKVVDITKTGIQFLKNLTDLHCRHTTTQNQSPISKSPMTIKAVTLYMSRQHSQKTFPVVEHHRGIMKALLMIVHISAI